LAASACGSADEPSDSSSDGGQPPSGSEIPTDLTLPGSDYSYTVNAGCGERTGLIGLYRIKVAGGEVARVWPLSGSEGAVPTDVPTIDQLVEEAKTAEREGADEVTVTTSPMGYPHRITIDQIADAIDDEVCYTISDVVRESASTRPWTQPRPSVSWTAQREIRLTTYGSSTCPLKLDSVQARGSQSVVLRLDGPDPWTICSMDLAPHHSIVDPPSKIDRRAEQLTFVVMANGKQPLVLTLDQNEKLRGR
jgi:Family of unknown function (DUF6174)